MSNASKASKASYVDVPYFREGPCPRCGSRLSTEGIEPTERQNANSFFDMTCATCGYQFLVECKQKTATPELRAQIRAQLAEMLDKMELECDAQIYAINEVRNQQRVAIARSLEEWK